MSTSTPSAATVTSRSAHELPELEAERLAGELLEKFLGPRERHLKRRAPRSSYVHELRRKLRHGSVRPLTMLLAISVADLDDGVPHQLVVEPYLEIVALLNARAGSGREGNGVHTLPMLSLVQRMERAESALTQAEHEVLVDPNSPTVLDRVLQAEATLEVESGRLVGEIRARRASAVLNGHNARNYCAAGGA